jgi:hypothetical protein
MESRKLYKGLLPIAIATVIAAPMTLSANGTPGWKQC